MGVVSGVDQGGGWRKQILSGAQVVRGEAVGRDTLQLQTQMQPTYLDIHTLIDRRQGILGRGSEDVRM